MNEDRSLKRSNLPLLLSARLLPADRALVLLALEALS